MRKIVVLLVLLALLALPALALLPATREETLAPPATGGARVAQVDSAHYPDVTLYVGVTDEAGGPIGGLARADFSVTEDGQAVDITSFAGVGGAIATALVIDRSGSMEDADKIEGARDAAQAYVGQMRPSDRTALIAFDSDAEMLQPFTANADELREAIDRIEPDGGTALYDSLVAGVDALAGAGGRRALVVLTDGQDCRDSSACPDRYGSERSLGEAIEYANQHAQPVYVIGLGDRGSDEREGIDEAVLEQIARETGGAYFYAPDADALAELYRQLSADLHSEYALTYRSPRPHYDGTQRDIQVLVRGMAPAGGEYVERHLINVRSDPLVGLLLLLPIVGALTLPGLLRRRTGGAPHAPAPAPAPAIGSTIMAAPEMIVIPPDVPHCRSCDAPLLHATARFCAACGAAQEEAATPAHRRFCDQCGRPLRTGARFCSACGTTALVQSVSKT